MNATVKLTVRPRNEIHTEERVQWIERFGVPPETVEVEITAPLALWEEVGAEIRPDGTVTAIPTNTGPYWRRGAASEIGAVLRAALLTTGTVPTTLDATGILGAMLELNRASDRAEAVKVLAEVREDAWRADDGAHRPYIWQALTEGERAEVVRLHDERTAAEARREAERKAAKAREEAAAQAAKDRASEEIRAFALGGHAGDAAQRAAREEYDVRSAVIDAVQQQLPTPDAVSRPKDDYAWEERASPTGDALDLRDRLVAAVSAVAAKPACVSIEVSRVMRITEPAEEGEEGARRTGVVVTIAFPVTEDRHLLYFVE